MVIQVVRILCCCFSAHFPYYYVLLHDIGCLYHLSRRAFFISSLPSNSIPSSSTFVLPSSSSSCLFLVIVPLGTSSLTRDMDMYVLGCILRTEKCQAKDFSINKSHLFIRASLHRTYSFSLQQPRAHLLVKPSVNRHSNHDRFTIT